MTSNSKAEGRFSKLDFIYIARDDDYLCPAGERLRRHQTRLEDGMNISVYWMGSAHFLMKTLHHVGTEMSLHVLAYNLKRVVSVLGIAKTMKAMQLARA